MDGGGGDVTVARCPSLGVKFDSRIRIDPRAPKTLFRLFEPIVWRRSVWHEYHGLMPEALSVLR